MIELIYKLIYKLAGIPLSPFLKIAVMLALSQSSGTSPVLTDCWKMWLTMGANSLLKTFKRYDGTPSGPLDFFGFIPCNSCSTTSVSIVREPMVGSGSSCKWGTLQNCLLYVHVYFLLVCFVLFCFISCFGFVCSFAFLFCFVLFCFVSCFL